MNLGKLAGLALSIGLIGIAGPKIATAQDTVATFDFSAVAPICPCFSQTELLAQEPVICTKFVVSDFSVFVQAGDLSAGAGFAPIVAGFCANDGDEEIISFVKGKACARFIEDTVGPCADLFGF